MSYCRWSSMNWMCDIYAYEDVSGGWTTHVSGRRYVRAPVSDEWAMEALIKKEIGPEEFAKAHRATMEDLEAIPLEPIGLAHDGESFNDPDLESFRDRLAMLREAGYKLPDYVFEAIAEEIAERDDDEEARHSAMLP